MRLIRPSIAQLISSNGEVINLTDHGRAPMSIDYQTIENAQRMADGRMRKYVIASKKTINFSWSMIPSLSNIINISSYRQIKSVNRVDGVASVETLTPHGYSIGQIVNINSSPKEEYNGSYKILDVPSTTIFTFSQPSLGRDVGITPVLIISNSIKNLKSFKRVNNIVTIETETAHGYTTGQKVEISPSEQSASEYNLGFINGEYTITVPSTTSFTFPAEGGDIYAISATEVSGTEVEIIKMRKHTSGDGTEYIYLESKNALPSQYNAGSGTYVKLSGMNEKDGKDYNGIIKMTGGILTPGTRFAGEFINENGAPDIIDWTNISARAVVVENISEGAVTITGTSQRYEDTASPRINIYAGETHIETFRSATADELPGAGQIKNFYEKNISKPVKLNLFYANSDLPTEKSRITPRTFEGTDYKISSRQRVNGISTITINRDHGLKVGDVIEVVHLTQSNFSFNGQHIVSNVISPTSFQYKQQLKPNSALQSTEDGYIKTITQTPSESFEVFMISCNFSVIKRLDDMDYWDMSLTLEEV